MIIEETIQFLKKVPPFQFLSEADIRVVAENLILEFYEKDTVILKQDDQASDSLRIIKKGGAQVSVRTESGEMMILDQRGQGDTFGLMSLIGGDKQKTTVTALEDTTCYLLGREKMLKLIEMNPGFTEYFLQFHFTKYVEKVYGEMHNRSLFYGSSDHLLFTTPVGDIATKDVVTVRDKSTIREAASRMAKHRISSLIVVDGNQLPVGIVTDCDLREKVVARGRSVDDAVKDIMSLPLVRIDAQDCCFEAVLKMIKHEVHHVLIIKDGTLKGILTNHDLMLLQGSSPLSFVKDLEGQESIDGVVTTSAKINDLVVLLLKDGARASNIAKILTELNDRVVGKVLNLAERKLGPPPVPYCWIAFGNEGRKEQTFKAEQDNAIIYADPADAAQTQAAERYFPEFTRFVRDGLVKCGFPLCPADYMASNPAWRRSLSGWNQAALQWMASDSPESLVRALMLFDFRFLHGDATLAHRFREFLMERVKEQNRFRERVAVAAVRSRPALGFFKSLLVERDGDFKNRLNVMSRGLGPIVEIVRAFAMNTGVSETSTLERIEAMKGKHPTIDLIGNELSQVFEFMLMILIHHQVRQMQQGRQRDHFIDPESLSDLEKQILKESFQIIARAQALLSHHPAA